jgi:hypothetical protein
MGPEDHSDRGLRGVEGRGESSVEERDARGLEAEEEEAEGGGREVGVTLGTEGSGLLGGRELRKKTRNQSLKRGQMVGITWGLILNRARHDDTQRWHQHQRQHRQHLEKAARLRMMRGLDAELKTASLAHDVAMRRLRGRGLKARRRGPVQAPAGMHRHHRRRRRKPAGGQNDTALTSTAGRTP